MASGNFTFATGNKYITGKIDWSSTSNGAIANSSTVKATLSFRKSSSSTSSTTGTFKGVITIDGTDTSFSKAITLNANNSWVTIGTATKTVQHGADGTKSIRISSSGGIGTLSFNYTNQGQTVTLDAIPRQAIINSANNFNDEQNPYMTFSNAGGFTMNAKLEAGGDTALITRPNIPNTGNYTFVLTEAERNKLRAKCPNSNTLTVRYTIETIISNTKYYNYVDRTMTIVNANPTEPSLAYQDTNSTTTAITGDNQRIIRNNSQLRAIIGTSTAKKSATIKSYSTTINGVTKTGNGNIDMGTVNLSNNGELVVVVTDSRGNTTTVKKTVIIDDWVEPTAIISLYRVNNYETTSKLLVDSKYSSLNGKNTISCEYTGRKTTDSSSPAYTSINNNELTTIQADNLFEWVFSVRIRDKLSGWVYYNNLTLAKGLPILFIDTEKRSIGINCFPSKTESVESNGLQIDDLVYVGSQVLYDKYSMTTSGTFTLLGAYDYKLIDGLFNGITIPSAYEKAYRLTAQGTTNNENRVSVAINNISSSAGNTWSANTFRCVVASRIFKQSELTLEQTMGYSKKGLNLKVTNSGNYDATVWSITIHGYLVKTTTELSATALSDDEPSEA